MAKRRMFSLDVIDTDLFVDMPTSSQNLYFHLCMRADDDGFISSPNKIMKMIGANKNDMDVLLIKKFLIPFESGVCVIRHWKINNYLRIDRYTETIYKEEKNSLVVKNDIYESDADMLPIGIPTVNTGKDSIGKYRLVEDRLDKISKDKYNVLDKSPIGNISFLEKFIENKINSFKSIELNASKPGWKQKQYDEYHNLIKNLGKISSEPENIAMYMFQYLCDPAQFRSQQIQTVGKLNTKDKNGNYYFAKIFDILKYEYQKQQSKNRAF